MNKETHINIGVACKPSLYLKEKGLRKKAYAFDWVFCRSETIVELIENDFKDFLKDIEVFKKKKYCQGEAKYVLIDKTYDIYFAHQLFKNNLNGINIIRENYKRRIKRLKKVFKRSKKVNLYWSADINDVKEVYGIENKIHIKDTRLMEVLEKKYPKTKFNLVILDKQGVEK